MIERPSWLPALITLSEYKGNWRLYIDFVYSIFYSDFIQSQPQFNGYRVRCRRDPIMDGKEAGFWHCTSEGSGDEKRVPDFRRCERVGWIRSIIENSQDSHIKIWQAKKRQGLRTYLWLCNEYLVVLGNRRGYFQLITAFCTDRGHTIRKLQVEYEMSIKD